MLFRTAGALSMWSTMSSISNDLTNWDWIFVRRDKLLKSFVLRKHIRHALFAAQQTDGARVTSGSLASNSKIFKLRRELTCIVADGACKL